MGVRDESLIEPFAVQEIYVDGFTDHTIINGNMSCVGYRVHPPTRANGAPIKVIVVKLVWPAGSTEDAINDARKAQRAPVVIGNIERAKRSH